MSSSNSASASKPRPSQSASAASPRANTAQSTSGSTKTMPSVACSGENRKWLNAECRSTASAYPGASARQRHERLLDEGRDVARIGGEFEVRKERTVHRIGDAGSEHAGEHHADDRARPHELVAVEQEQHGEERGDGQEPERRAQNLRHHMIFTETIHSSPVRTPPR